MLFSVPLASSRKLERIVAPVSEPISVSEAKLFMRIDHTTDDILISDMIVACRMAAEQYLQRSVLTQSWKLSLDGGNCYACDLAMGPVNAISKVSVFDNNDVEVVLTSEQYRVNAAQDHLQIVNVSCSKRVEVSYVAGYPSVAAVPGPMKQGIMAHILHMYENRGDMKMPSITTALFQHYRNVRI